MSKVAGADAGFVMVDALFAVALLALVGTIALAISTSTLQSYDRLLKRSSALTTLDTFARMLRQAGLENAEAILPLDDEHFRFRYEIERSGQHLGRLVQVTLSASPKNDDTSPITLELWLVGR